MKGKIVFTFKDKVDGVTGIKQKIALRDVDAAALTKAIATFVKRVTPTKKDAEKFVAALYCVVVGKLPPSQILTSFAEMEEPTDE